MGSSVDRFLRRKLIYRAPAPPWCTPNTLIERSATSQPPAPPQLPCDECPDVGPRVAGGGASAPRQQASTKGRPTPHRRACQLSSRTLTCIYP